MKSIIAIILIITVSFSNVMAQANMKEISVDKVPVVVAKTFRTKFPSAQKEVWAMPKSDTYRVTFFVGDKKFGATYDKTGQLMGYMAFVKDQKEIQEKLLEIMQ